MAAKVDQEKYRSALLRAPSSLDKAETARTGKIMLDRCRGFIDNDHVANHALRRQITDLVRGSGEYVVGISAGEVSPAQFQSILDRKGKVTFGMVFADVGQRVTDAHGIRHESSD